MILRTAEIFRCKVMLVDTYKVMEDANKVSKIADHSCGALDRGETLRIATSYGGLVAPNTRVVEATSAGRAEAHSRFHWQSGDCVLFGNEYSGVPSLVSELAQSRVRIETPQGYFPKLPSNDPIDAKRVAQIVDSGSPVLNVAVAASVIMVDAVTRCGPLRS